MSTPARPRVAAVRWLARLAIALAVLLPAAPAAAKDLLDHVIEAIDPTLAPARPLIECLVGGGDALGCGKEVAADQGKAALPIAPTDDRVQKAVKIFVAARDERWLDVVTIGGELVARTVACAVLPVSGPAKGAACAVIGWLVGKNAKVLDQAYQALKGPDWWALVDLLGSGVCQFMPSDGAAGAAKDVLCGALAEVLLAAKQFATQLASGLVAGADALEDLIFGDDSHMPYDTYYAMYWQPWYHLAVDRLLKEQSIDGLAASIYGPCVDYFDAHDQYRSTARKTCKKMRDQKFGPHTRAFAEAMPVAVDGYFQAVARPAIRVAVMLSFGKPAAEPLPGQAFFLQNCAFQMRARFPFPEPNDARCALLEQRAESFPGFASLFTKLAKDCRADVAAQEPSPTAWARACDAMAPAYGKAFAGEALKLLATIKQLKAQGCALGPPASGLALTCDGHAGYGMCLAALHPSGAKYCKVAVVARVSDTVKGGATVASGGTPVVTTGVLNVEAEALVDGGAVATRGRAVAQDMAGFGQGWSGDRQLLFAATEVGATLELPIEVPVDGTYAVELHLAAAPDYGQLAIAVDGQRSTVPFEGFAPRVMPPRPVQVGTFALAAGARRVTLRVTGRYQDSTGYLAGVDRVRLYWVRGREVRR